MRVSVGRTVVDGGDLHVLACFGAASRESLQLFTVVAKTFPGPRCLAFALNRFRDTLLRTSKAQAVCPSLLLHQLATETLRVLFERANRVTVT